MSNKRNVRKTYRGTVISDKMDKTITVLITTFKDSATYGKRYKYSKKYKAEDPKNEAHIGDTVDIMNTRKLSATKHARLVKIVARAK